MTTEIEAFRRHVHDYIAANAPDLPYRVGTRSPENADESALLLMARPVRPSRMERCLAQ